MKKAIVFGTIAALSFAAHAEMQAPKVSGRIAHAFTYLTQDGDGEDYSPMTGLSPINAIPSYLRVSGNIPVNEMMNVDYVAEIDIRLSKVGGLGVRQSAVNVNTKAGTLVLGQTYTPISAIGSYDLLTTTTAHLGSTDIGNVKYASDMSVGMPVDGIGLRHTLRQNVVGYKTPEFAGLSLFAAHDSNQNNDSKVAGNPLQRYDVALNYSNAFGGTKVMAMADYLIATGNNSDKEQVMTAAAKVSAMGIDVSFGYQMTSFEAFAKDSTKDNMFAGIGYTMGAHNVAFTYGSATVEDKNSTPTDKYEADQMALGYTHTFNKNLKVNVVGAMINIEDKTSGSTIAKTEATMVSTGMCLTF